MDVDLLVVPGGNCIKDIKVCPECDHGNGSYRALGEKLNIELIGKITPTPIRMNVSGCGCRCAMAMLQDIGLVAGLEGYAIYIGGTPYSKSIIAEKIIGPLTDEEVFIAIKAILCLYKSERGD
ncbi:MAG: hypothetical protein JJT76_09290 [Clostridiaceae bacterium]|nr:hypothetical protein [Clostridiaceae bacterium]